LTDILLPGTSSRELAAVLTERRPEMKVLYMGGFAETGGTFEDIVRGPAFLESPFSSADLSRKIEQLLGTGVANSFAD
jgi:two-component system, cell cycle sensor histidine kinase and response regulator CckA